jgi:hypothetical protein
MSSTTLYQPNKTLGTYFKPGPSWSSFERFRLSGPGALDSVNSGAIGILRVKESQYRILSESDFQYLLGLAAEVDRLKNGLKVVLCAAKVVQMHHDEPSMETLRAALAIIVNIPELPVRRDFDSIEPEGLFENTGQDEDEIEIDNIVRPFDQ